MTSLTSEIKTLEHATLKVPYEILNKKFRAAQKILDREAAGVAQTGGEIEKLVGDVLGNNGNGVNVNALLPPPPLLSSIMGGQANGDGGGVHVCSGSILNIAYLESLPNPPTLVRAVNKNEEDVDEADGVNANSNISNDMMMMEEMEEEEEEEEDSPTADDNVDDGVKNGGGGGGDTTIHGPTTSSVDNNNMDADGFNNGSLIVDQTNNKAEEESCEVDNQSQSQYQNGNSEKMLFDDDTEDVNGSNSNSNASTSSSDLDENKALGLPTTPRGPKGKDVAKLLGALVDRLGSLKRKAGESIQDELEAARAVRQRVNHFKSVVTPNEVITPPLIYGRSNKDTKEKLWKRIRLNRMLVDHLLREGMYDTAKMLAEDLGIKQLTNVDVFWAAKEVEESLKRHETARMVAWCYENKSKLRKIKSTLELEIRVQEFVELVRIGRRGDAVKHARKYLADSEPEHIAAVKKCMGLLAFPPTTTLTPYAELLSPERWKHLVTHFRQEHARLYQLSSSSVLAAVVQAGLASLKTPQCYRPTTKNPNCPVCSDPLSTLAQNLPFAHCAHSQLVCAISGEPLNENNPPLVLPSGFVYGTRSLQDMARTNGGKVICPRTSQIFSLTEADKVYVM